MFVIVVEVDGVILGRRCRQAAPQGPVRCSGCSSGSGGGDGGGTGRVGEGLVVVGHSVDDVASF